MLVILNITAPIFMVMGLGFCAVRLAWFKLEELQGAAKFVMRVGLPALVFYVDMCQFLISVGIYNNMQFG